jgi:hypothetical protein
MHKKTPKSKIKVVISTCKGYETFIHETLKGLDHKNHIDDIVIVQGRCDSERITSHDGIIVICSTKNLFDYISFDAVARYIDHPAVESDKYLFLHDTVEITDTAFFWKTLNELDKKTDNGCGFYYLCNKKLSAGNNIGIGIKEFVIEYGSNFWPLHSISKPLAIALECGRNMPTHPIICQNADSVKGYALEPSTEVLASFTPTAHRSLLEQPVYKLPLPGMPWAIGPGAIIAPTAASVIDVLKRLSISRYCPSSLSDEGSSYNNGTEFPILRIKKVSGRRGAVSRVQSKIPDPRHVFPFLISDAYYRYNIPALEVVINGCPEKLKPIIFHNGPRSDLEAMEAWLVKAINCNLDVLKVICIGDELAKYPKERESIVEACVDFARGEYGKFPYFLNLSDLTKRYERYCLDYKIHLDDTINDLQAFDDSRF